MDLLGEMRPDDVPHATSYVDEMVELITAMLDKGVGYRDQ
jgi:cysteinyl-tRNA synthetase